MIQILRIEKVLLNIQEEIEESTKLKDIIYRANTEKEDKKKLQELEEIVRRRLQTKFAYTHKLMTEIIQHHQ